MRLLITTAIIALSAGASFAQDLTSSNSTISVSGGTLANQPVSFGNQGRILNNGFGTGSLASSISVAQFGAAGFASMAPSVGAGTIATSTSGAAVDSSFTRQVETTGSSIGIGTLTVAGTAQNAFSGDVDAASNGEIRSIQAGVPAAGRNTLTTSTAGTTGTAALAGGGLTSSGLQLTGTTNGFVGTGSNEVAGTQRSVALGANATSGAAGSGQSIGPFVQADLAAGTLGNLVPTATTGEAGLVFVFDDSNSTIGTGGSLTAPAAGAISGVNMTIPNLGGGSILVEANTNGTTSGFFGATGTSTFGQIVTP